MSIMSIPVNTGGILDMQRKLYVWSRNDPRKVFSDLFNLVCDRRTLWLAWQRLRRNAGSQTPGVDKVTRRRVEERPGGVAALIEEIHEELRTGTFVPQAVRQRVIPKPGKPGKFRALGIPTLKDRLVQMALKIVLEPIFEADFYPTSYGFRRGRSPLDALATIVQQLHPPNQGGESRVQHVIEGDITACFDHIDHHRLMEALRQRIRDNRVLRLIRAFLKAGIFAEGKLRHPVAGTPQGGIISPLLANVYLTKLDARYRRWIPNPGEGYRASNARRVRDRAKGRPTFYLVRYADDFVILTDGTRQEAEAEKTALTDFLREELGMELSQEKTIITHAEEGFVFLGYRVVKERAYHSGRLVGKLYIPKEKLQLLRTKLKRKTDRATIWMSMDELLKSLNPLIIGWRNYFKYAVGACTEFTHLDWFLGRRIWRWIRKKHPRRNGRYLCRKYRKQESPTRKGWGGETRLLRRFGFWETTRYRSRGTKISNGWNNELDQVQSHLAAARSVVALGMFEDRLR